MGFLSLPDKWRDEDDEPRRMNVSVIVATCGDEKWNDLAIERALPSATTQSVGSKVLHAHYPDLTVASARNALAAVAHGDWLCFLDADDELEPGYLDAMARTYQESLFTPVAHAVEPLLVPKLRRVAAGITDIETVGPARIPNQGKWPMVNECVIGTLVHRNLFEAVGGFRDYTDDGTPIDLYEDWDLWLRCWDAGAKLVYTDAVYREHVNPNGRNYSPSPTVTYDEIWRDHKARDRRPVSGMSLVFEPVRDGSGKWLVRQYDVAHYFRDDESAREYAERRGYTPIFLDEPS